MNIKYTTLGKINWRKMAEIIAKLITCDDYGIFTTEIFQNTSLLFHIPYKIQVIQRK